MNNKQMAEQYAEGGWIAVFSMARKWSIAYTPTWHDEGIYKLIAEHHSDILDAYLDGCDICSIPEEGRVFNETELFLVDYSKDTKYLAIPKSLDNSTRVPNLLNQSN